MNELISRASQPYTDRNFDFRGGELLLLDKPKDWTSFDVVNKVRYRLRRITQVKRIKVGHSGTLDPMATGLLVIAVGKATKKINDLVGLPKVYTGTIKFGATTPSFDAETDENATFPTEHLSIEMLQEKVAEQFTGWIEQVPPIYSAIKVDGKRLYKAARAGQEVEVPSRRVHIESFELSNFTGTTVDFRTEVSKGTYIRSLANDLGAAALSGGYLVALRRERVGSFSVNDAYSVEEFSAYLDNFPTQELVN